MTDPTEPLPTLPPEVLAEYREALIRQLSESGREFAGDLVVREAFRAPHSGWACILCGATLLEHEFLFSLGLLDTRPLRIPWHYLVCGDYETCQLRAAVRNPHA